MIAVNMASGNRRVGCLLQRALSTITSSHQQDVIELIVLYNVCL